MPQIVTDPPRDALRPNGLFAGGWWHEEDEHGRIVCDLCPRECHLKPGDRGFCFVRENVGGEMVLTTYGRSTGFCIDPIEKKPLNQFLPGTSVLSFGTAGCNLGCKFCQNWDISKSREIERLSELATPEAIAEAARQLNCRSVAFTYNDPVIWAEYAIDTAKACHSVGVKTVAVTAGYITPLARGPFYEVMDAANVDLKGFSEDFYQHLTLSHLQPVLDTLEWLKQETNVWFEITNLMIPQANDSPDEVRRMCDWILKHVGDEVPVHFTAFHPDFRMRDRPNTPHETLLMAWDIACETGLKYAYVGNVNDVAHQSTFCPNCGKLVIERDWYELGRYDLDGNRCRHCGGRIGGVFEQRPGNWGRKRQPVQISRYARSLPVVTRSTTPLSPLGRGAGGEGRAEQRANHPSPLTPLPKGERGTADSVSLVPLDPRPSTLSPPLSTLHPPPSMSNTSTPDPKSNLAFAAPSNTPSAAVSSTATFEGRGGRANLTEISSLTVEQERAIHRAACDIVAAAIEGRPERHPDPTLGGTSYHLVMGAFVTLKRQGHLRACCGSLGTPFPLADALRQAAFRTATGDVRFPSISATELPHLSVDVTLLFNFQGVTARGTDRVSAVKIGRHGLQIRRGNQSGLLLPSVATEHGLDTEAFLKQVCKKAGLPSDAWQADDTQLVTFEGHSIHGPMEPEVLTDSGTAAAAVVPRLPFTPTDVGNLAAHCRTNVAALLRRATPNYYLFGCRDGTVTGVALTIRGTGLRGPSHMAQFSLRPGVPLQATLFQLAQTAAATWPVPPQGSGIQRGDGLEAGVTILLDPAMHGTVAKPDLAGIDPRRRAILIVEGGRNTWVFNPRATADELFDQVRRDAHVSIPDAAAVFSLEVISTEESVTVSNVPKPLVGQSVRPPAVAGTFYPGDANELSRLVDDFLESASGRAKKWPAVMVPHAGLKYSGRLAAAVFRRAKIPDTVIVLGPKHTRLGVEWAVAPHETWRIPTGEIASDPELARRLADNIPGLQLDAAAHAQEHGIEVELPFLHKLASSAKVVGMAIGGGDLERCRAFARGLAGVIRQLPKPPLLVISSDMNHFEDDAETRRRDALALACLDRLDAADLLQTCRDHDISMCGVLPAVIVLETLRELGQLKTCERVGYATSGDITGDLSRVVGYAGMLFGG